MAQQTINVGTAPNDGTGTPLRTAFQYTNSNFSELYTAVGPSGNNIVVPGNATITGDLTVDTNTLKVNSSANRVGVLTASPESELDVRGLIAVRGTPTFPSTGVGIESYYSAANTSSFIQSYDRGGGAFANLSYSALAHIWQINGGEAMRLNSTGLGVGGSPVSGNKLFVEGSAQIGSSSTTGTNRLTIDGLGTVGNVPTIRFRSAGAAKAYVGLSGAYLGDTSTDLLLTTDAAGASVKFGSSDTGTVKMTLDSSGNVGIGVTPKPWRSGARALQLGANGYVSLHEQSNGNANLCFAAYEGSANVFNYTTTGDLPSRYVLVSGTHQWYTAPSGTAGNAITFTEVMRLDASGNLILLPSNTPPALGTNGQLTVNATSNTNLRFSYRGSDGVTRVANLTLA